jgi:hypothetical protein
MTFTAIVSGIFAIAKAVPVFAKWLDQLVALYIQHKKDQLSQEIKDAIKEAVGGNQIPIEQTIGYSNAGEVSNLPGAVVVDCLPGVGVCEPKKD